MGSSDFKLAQAMADHVVPDPGSDGTISSDRNFVCSATSVQAGDPRYVAAPTFVGQRAIIAHDVDGGAIALNFLDSSGAVSSTRTLAGVKKYALAYGTYINGKLAWIDYGN
jgi:hypothetical protein